METNSGRVNFERRKYPRFSVELPVAYWKINNSVSHPAQTGDVSEGGLLLYISGPVEIGEDFALTFSLPFGLELKPIQARVRVVWKDLRFDKEGYFRIGVKFLDIGREDFQSLKQFLQKLVHEKSLLNSSPFHGFR